MCKTRNDMTFELPSLPYDANALESVISEKTLHFHHDKHLAAYLENTNKLIKDTRFSDMDLVSIIKESEGALFNNAAQSWNHIFYFECFSSKHGMQPKGELLDKIIKKWGTLDEFKAEFVKQGVAQFGSGWVWLIKNAQQELEIIKTANAGNPLTMEGAVPLLTFDVWEHAYYLDYQNRRGDALNAAWQVVNWDKVEERYLKK